MPGAVVLLALLGAALVSVLLAVLGSWQAGLLLLGGVLLVAAGLRLMLPPRWVGLLAVRSRIFDAVLLAVLGGAVVVLTSSLARTH